MQKGREAFRTIGEVASWLGVPPHVLRFWESKFTQVRPVKRAGGRRYYRRGDMALLGGIKVLLHDRGMTIKGVQRILSEDGPHAVVRLAPDLDDLGEPEDALGLLDAMDAEGDGAEAQEMEAPEAEAPREGGRLDAGAPDPRPDGVGPAEDRPAETEDLARPAALAAHGPDAAHALGRVGEHGQAVGAPTEPEAWKAEPEAFEGEPEAWKAEPEAFEGEPEAWKAEPEACEDEPERKAGGSSAGPDPDGGGPPARDAARSDGEAPPEEPLAAPSPREGGREASPSPEPPDPARDAAPPMPARAPAFAEAPSDGARADALPPAGIAAPEIAAAQPSRDRVVPFVPAGVLVRTPSEGRSPGWQTMAGDRPVLEQARPVASAPGAVPDGAEDLDERLSPMDAPGGAELDDDAAEDAARQGAAAAREAEASGSGPRSDDGDPAEAGGDREASAPEPLEGGEPAPGAPDDAQPAAERRRRRVAAVPDCAEGEGALPRRPSARPSIVRANNDAILALVRRLEAVRERMDP